LVEISPPPPSSSSDPKRGSRAAKATAVLDGKGGVKEVVMVDMGMGYRGDKPIVVRFIHQVEEERQRKVLADEREEEDSSGIRSTCFEGAVGVVVLDREVAEVKVVDGGGGYVLQMGTKLTFESPAAAGGEADGEQARGMAVLAPTVERTSDPMSSINDMYQPTSQTILLQQLLPTDVAITYDTTAGRFRIYNQGLTSSIIATGSMLDPLFGPVGKSPLEKETELTVEAYLRLALSGGLCIATVRTLLTPIEIIKTRLQARPEDYDGWLDGISKISKESGGFVQGMTKGWDITAFTGFLLGLSGFGFNEFLRRIIGDWVGPGSSEVFSIPIILAASALSTIITSILVCPIEATRIRLMSTPGSVEVGGFIRIGKKVLEDSGVMGLFDGLEPLLFREVPFQLTKFLVYDVAQSALFRLFPAAQESLNSSLMVSLVSGLIAGIAGAIIGCPADAVLTRVNAAPDVVDWRAMVKVMLNSPGGWKNLFAGVDVRMVFFSLVISIQFFLYDYFKALLDVSSEDLVLVLDVFSDTAGTTDVPGV